MDPVIDNEWLGCKNEPEVEEKQDVVGNIARSWQWRERGINPTNHPSNKTVLENMAEDILVQKPLQIRVWLHCFINKTFRSNLFVYMSLKLFVFRVVIYLDIQDQHF